MAYIYKLTNNVNGKIYVGQTSKTLEERLNSHIRDMNREKFKHRPIYLAMRKYGIENFSIEEIEECDNAISNDREKFWIKYFNSCVEGYNVALGGAGKPLYSQSEIYDLLIAGFSVRKICEKIGCSADVVYGVARQNNIDTWSSGLGVLTFMKSTKTVLVTDNLKNKYIFPSVSETAKYIKEKTGCKSSLNGMRSHIADCCNGKRKSAYGYSYQYA